MTDFTTRFNELLAKYPGSDTELGAALGVSKQTISAWRLGKRFPKRPVVRTIAAYFNVGIPWLLGATDNVQLGMYSCENDESGANHNLDARENELVTIYRDLNAKGQDAMLTMARSLKSNPEMKRGGELKNETA